MSPEREYKYDVAFSFLAQDEELATRLNELVRDRLSTFIYSEHQDELAGTDGEEAFNRVFGEDARTAVILYRNGWGEAGWTRIEQTAIRNRAMAEGYDFTLFIPLEPGVTFPRWLPRAQIWFNRNRWGNEGTAAVIAAHVQRAGGTERQETVTDRAARLVREVEADRAREAFLRTNGVSAADAEIAGLFQTLEELTGEISTSTLTFTFRLEEPRRLAAIWGPRSTLTFRWICPYSNVLDESELTVTIWKGAAPIGNRWFRDGPEELEQEQYDFDLSRSGEMGWREVTGQRLFFSSRQLAERALKTFLGTVERLQRNRQ